MLSLPQKEANLRSSRTPDVRAVLSRRGAACRCAGAHEPAPRSSGGRGGAGGRRAAAARALVRLEHAEPRGRGRPPQLRLCRHDACRAGRSAPLADQAHYCLPQVLQDSLRDLSQLLYAGCNAVIVCSVLPASPSLPAAHLVPRSGIHSSSVGVWALCTQACRVQCCHLYKSALLRSCVTPRLPCCIPALEKLVCDSIFSIAGHA